MMTEMKQENIDSVALELRLRALELAIQLGRTVSADDIVEFASTFETYLRGQPKSDG
ncbi:hypothetical protein [Sphingobium sp. CAP-1]|uniref:hypothetical protein n=1 Tax=Sphingobium sp. CAP-1 TaxID=2676077 RepID=UPI001E625E30|nr:hypothetical protein [Sphingobium sp. CAP-1]